MFQIERQAAIIEYLKDHKKSNVEELCEHFCVSKATIRRDITELANAGRLIKAHGGVLFPDSIQYQETPYLRKKDINQQSKQKIGERAVQLIQDGDIIIVDSGSTTFEMIRHINKHITLLTHDLMIALAAAENSNIRTILAGGQVHHKQYALTGYTTATFYRNYRASLAFLACDAVDPETGLWTTTPEETAIKSEIIQCATRNILLTDHTKFSTTAFCRLCGIESIDCIISDCYTDATRAALSRYDVELL